MGKTQERKENSFKKKSNRIVQDPDTGLKVLKGSPFTKKDVARDFPDSDDRDAIIVRKSVGL